VYRFKEALRLLATLEFENLGTVSMKQVRRRLNTIDPARCFHVRISHDTVLKVMRVRKHWDLVLQGDGTTGFVARRPSSLSLERSKRSLTTKQQIRGTAAPANLNYTCPTGTS
jgi:hypothetical protein